MPVPKRVTAPPFNVLRCSHVVYTVTDLGRSRAYYEETIGLHVQDAGDKVAWLRGMEERGHHSLVLRQEGIARAERLGFKLASEDDLERAEHFFRARGLPCARVEVPYQGPTLHVTDPMGDPLEFFASMEQTERLLQQYGRYRGCHPQRLDHFNVFSRDVQGSVDFYAAIGFRLTEYTETDDDAPRIAAAWMHRKGTVHDVAFTNGRGPRLHHVAYLVPSAMHIIQLLDLMATTGWLSSIERGPGRHGISNAFFVYVRDPDGHRTEIYAGDYLTVDPDLEPIRWSISDPRRQTLWGMPAPRSWFEEGTPFRGVVPEEPVARFESVMAD
ncbi:3,4-dihydroxyphenylacetate 2,3-dioxygenase [Falsiroseomonas sp. HW251]|uniref:3,4-dihydroxyphenylacetate 2,3-dioxygenase n=1 Tax=Falsiroseomonas sp. HW251 TaxID=3390998 RepID=UPI003D321AE0